MTTTMKSDQRNGTKHRGARWNGALSVFVVGMLFAATTQAWAQRLFLENFDELKLGPSVEGSVAGAQVWTKSVPAGWTIDDSKMPGFGDPSEGGMTEWFGWSCASKAWWVRTTDDQRRSEFSL